MYCDGYKGKGRLHDNHQVGLKLWTEDTQGAVMETRIG